MLGFINLLFKIFNGAREVFSVGSFLVFLVKTLYSHSASLHPGKPDEMLAGNCTVLLVISCYRDGDKWHIKFWWCRPLGLCVDFTFCLLY